MLRILERSDSMRNLRPVFALLAVTLLVTQFLGCKDDPVEPTKPEPPKINVASINVVCGDNQDCIEFFAKPSKDVIFVKVVITNPTGSQVTYNLQSSTVIAEQNIALQDDDFAYFRISGEWKFVFTGNLATGDKSSFEVTVIVNVSA